MSKIAIISKDLAVKTKSGASIPQSPDDQELVEGVRAAIDGLASNGLILALVSNESLCDPRPCPVENIRSGSYYVECDEYFEITGSSTMSVGIAFDLDRARRNNRDYIFTCKDEQKICYKTIANAAAEMKFALRLTGISRGIFCPDLAGRRVFYVGNFGGNFIDGVLGSTQKRGKELDSTLMLGFPDNDPSSVLDLERSQDGDFGDYQKGGMIDYLDWVLGGEDCEILYFGDRPDDEYIDRDGKDVEVIPPEDLPSYIYVPF